MLRFSFLLLSIISFSLLTAQNAVKAPVPFWVEEVGYSIDPEEEKADENTGGESYLLSDKQVYFPENARYYRHVIKLHSTESIESYSTITVNYDPSYQKLEFNRILIIRNGQTLDKLAVHQIEELRRETNLEYQMYDGHYTAIIRLSDIRKGDILEVSYTITGVEKVFENHKYTSCEFGAYLPLRKVFYKVTDRINSRLQYKLFNGAEKPEYKTHNGLHSWTWTLEDIVETEYEEGSPAWFNPIPYVMFSNYNNWGEILEKYIQHYVLTKEEKDFLQGKLNMISPGETPGVVDIIRFVQDDIRYLGMEVAANAYVPHSPVDVFANRFGDCKDKSLLLCGLLQESGVKAYPLLVNSTSGRELVNMLPSPFHFDHCVVWIEDHNIFIDPTMNLQGGELDSIYFPDYEYGLLVKKGESSLLKLPKPALSDVRVVEEFRVPDLDSDTARLEIKTRYSGFRADEIRREFESTSMKTVRKNYSDYYRSIYPEISAVNIKLNDEREQNILYVTEEYIIPAFWQLNESVAGEAGADFYAIQFEDLMNISGKSDRKAPYDLGRPYSLKQKTLIHLPEVWSAETANITINGPGYIFEHSVNQINNKLISLDHKYQVNQELISAEDFEVFRNDHSKMSENLSFRIFKNFGSSLQAGSMFGNMAITWIILILGAGSILMFRIYRRYDPPAKNAGTYYNQIGGWLVLPAIGLILSPLLIIRNLISNDYFEFHTWNIFITPESEFYNPALTGAYFIELSLTLILLLLTILCIISFFKRRSSTPRLMIILYTSAIITVLISHILLLIADSSLFSAETMAGEVLGRFIISSIWIVYFSTSDRVRGTFTRRIKTEEIESIEVEAYSAQNSV